MRLSSGLVVALLGLVACGRSDEQSKPAPAPAPAQGAAEPRFTPAAPKRMPGPAAQQLAMPSSATSLTVPGTLEAGKEAEYVIAGEKGTVFTAHADTPEHDLDISVYRADTGALLADETPRNPNFFMAHLPATMGYLIVIRGSDAPSPYRLEVEVPRKLLLSEKTKVVDVGYRLPAHGRLAYLTPPGMTVSAELTKGAPAAYLTAHGLAGKVFLKAADNKSTFTGTPVASTEGLVIRVEQGDADGDFTLRVQRK